MPCEQAAVTRPATSSRAAARLHAMFLPNTHELFGDQRRRVGRHGTLLQIEVFHVVLLGQRLIDVGFAAQVEADQCFADALVLGLAGFKGLGHFLLGDDPPIDENLAELLLLLGHEG